MAFESIFEVLDDTEPIGLNSYVFEIIEITSTRL